MQRLVLISPFYNAESTMEKYLASIYYQNNHSNWKIILLDDLSTDKSFSVVQKFCKDHKLQLRLFCNENNIKDYKIEDDQIIYIKNKNKLWEVENVLNALKICEDEDIICRIDPDDFLSDLCAFQDINLVYNNTKCDLLWTDHRWADRFWKNISWMMPGCYVLDYSKSVYEKGGERTNLIKIDGEKDIYKWSKNNWCTSHLKTFKKYLLNNVNDENYRSFDGKYIKRCGDRAIFYVAMHNSKMPVYFPKQMYYYTIIDKPETYNTEDSKFQKAESDYISDRGYLK